MKKTNNTLLNFFLILIIGIILIVLLVLFDVIDNPLNMITGNDAKAISLTTKSLELRKGEVTHLEVSNENDDTLKFTKNGFPPAIRVPRHKTG